MLYILIVVLVAALIATSVACGVTIVRLRRRLALTTRKLKRSHEIGRAHV